MSWGALRYQSITRICRRSARREAHAQEGDPGRYNVLRSEVLTNIFGSPRLDHALHLLRRLRSMKGRYPGARQPTGEFSRRHLNGRNWHHLTPQFRKGVSYHGGGSRNLMLIRISRHEVWHKIFGLMTLEEVIEFLERCRELKAGIWVAAKIRNAGFSNVVLRERRDREEFRYVA